MTEKHRIQSVPEEDILLGNGVCSVRLDAFASYSKAGVRLCSSAWQTQGQARLLVFGRALGLDIFEQRGKNV